MKKLIILSVAGFLLVLGMSSCKGTQDCPAYSQTTVDVPVEKA